jgi:phosphoribosyl-ATP pyrophosphohydrolase
MRVSLIGLMGESQCFHGSTWLCYENVMSDALDRLFATIIARKGSDPSSSYTAKLLADGVEKCAKKFGEEATETVIAAISRDKAELAKESADVLYHLLVLWAASGVTPEEVYAVLRAREGQSGLEEKASRKA